MPKVHWAPSSHGSGAPWLLIPFSSSHAPPSPDRRKPRQTLGQSVGQRLGSDRGLLTGGLACLAQEEGLRGKEDGPPGEEERNRLSRGLTEGPERWSPVLGQEREAAREERIKGRAAGERPLGALLSHGLGSSEAQRVGRRAERGKGSWVGWGKVTAGGKVLDSKATSSRPRKIHSHTHTHTHTHIFSFTHAHPWSPTLQWAQVAHSPTQYPQLQLWPGSWSLKHTLNPCPPFTPAGPEPRFSEASPLPPSLLGLQAPVNLGCDWSPTLTQGEQWGHVLGQGDGHGLQQGTGWAGSGLERGE